MKKISIIVLVFSSIIFSQFNRNNPRFNNRQAFVSNKIFYSQLYVSNQDSNKAFFVYKIPLNRLLFLKSQDKYKAKSRVSLEIINNKNNIIQREFDEKSVEVKSYKNTKSSLIYVEGVIPIVYSKDIRKIMSTFTDVFSKKEFKGKLINNDKIKNGKFFSPPIVVGKKKYECNGSDSFALANFGGDFPFSENKYEILIPTKNLETEELFIKIISNGKTILNKTIDDSFKGEINLEYCNDKILLKEEDTDKQYQFFILDNFDNKLSEGPFKIKISTTPDFANSVTYIKRITWFDKPFSLRNPETAIKDLKFIEDKSVINDMLDNESFQYAKLLQKYWKKYDPSPNTTYNPIMKEYYERIDYSIRNFSPISRKSGAKTDRGKIYIKYGKPNKIKRTSNTYGQVTEIWIYKKIGREFVFIDKYGIGDFSLITG